MILSNYYRSGLGSAIDEMDALAEKYGVSIEKRQEVSCLYASINIVSSHGWRAVLSEFPGNCSSLVLSNIQDGIPQHRDAIDEFMAFSIAVCDMMEYGALFASGTSTALREYLELHGFVPVLEGLFNPHSESFNTFYVKKFFQREETNV